MLQIFKGMIVMCESTRRITLKSDFGTCPCVRFGGCL